MDTVPKPGSSVLSDRTLVLNRTWTPVHVTSVRRALVMLYHRAALAVCPRTYATHDFSSWMNVPPDGRGRVVKTVRHEIPAPDIILLSKYDRLHIATIPFSRRNLYRRDQLRCQYCGRRQVAESLTIDHVIPRSQGGSTGWSNCVLACKTCNRKKGGRTPDQAGMRLLVAPARPDWTLGATVDAGPMSQWVLERWGSRSNSRAG